MASKSEHEQALYLIHRMDIQRLDTVKAAMRKIVSMIPREENKEPHGSEETDNGKPSNS